MDERELTCIVCPIGCSLKVRVEADGEVVVEGNLCPRGAGYAREEVTNPKRVVFTVVKVRGGELPTVSVKTSEPVPKSLVSEVMRATAFLEVEAPVEAGQVVLKGVCGVDLVATRSVKRREAGSFPSRKTEEDLTGG